MRSGAAFLVKNINKVPAFIICKTQPFTIKFGPEIFKRFKVICYSEYNARSLAHICSIFKTNWHNQRPGFIQHQLKTAHLPEFGSSPLLLPFYSLYIIFIAGKTLHHYMALLCCI